MTSPHLYNSRVVFVAFQRVKLLSYDRCIRNNQLTEQQKAVSIYLANQQCVSFFGLVHVRRTPVPKKTPIAFCG
jgi:hypothetical protein